MANIIFDDYLTQHGLNEDIFCRALKIKQSECQEHKLYISLVKTAKKKGLFLQIQVYMDDDPHGISIGRESYQRNSILKTITEIKENKESNKKLPGIWPAKDQSFILWLKQQIDQKSTQEKKIQKKQKKIEETRNRHRQFMNLLSEIPEQLSDEIKQLQEQVKQKSHPLFLLSYLDQKFLDGYDHNLSSFLANFDIESIETSQQLSAWIEKWAKRIKRALLAPAPSEYRIILELVAACPKYGATTYAMWLGKSKVRSLEQKRLDQKFRKLLAQYTIIEIADMVEKLCYTHGMLKRTHVGRHELPVLIISDQGRELLKKQTDLEIQPPKIKKTSSCKKKATGCKDLRKTLENKNRKFWLVFLQDDKAIKNMANWSEENIEQVKTLLNDIPGWQIPLLWELEKHPIKYKPLRRLL